MASVNTQLSLVDPFMYSKEADLANSSDPCNVQAHPQDGISLGTAWEPNCCSPVDDARTLDE